MTDRQRRELCNRLAALLERADAAAEALEAGRLEQAHALLTDVRHLARDVVSAGARQETMALEAA